MAKHEIMINRAPVLTLWASIVAERLGNRKATALTLGKAVAGLNAQSKGQRLGIYKPAGEEHERGKRDELPPGEESFTYLMGRRIPMVETEDGETVAAIKGKPITPDSVERYLEGKFGADLADVREAMKHLAKAHKPKELAAVAYSLYEKFRPKIPSGKRGWGAKGELDLDQIRSLGGGPKK
jgi:hypothetical protein